MTANQTQTVEAVIVGAGMAGLTLAHALASAGIEVAVVDRADPANFTDPAFDGRTTAIAAGSAKVLEGIGLWSDLAPKSCPIDTIRVSDGDALMFMHFDHHEVGDDPLGYILENRDIRGPQLAAAAASTNIELIAPASIEAVTRNTGGVTIKLEDGPDIRARVIFACDGRGSSMRQEAKIPVTEWRYDQSSFVCTIAHERPHQNIAHERFLPGGPFAILPLLDLETPIKTASGELRHAASIVWSEANDLVPAIKAFDDDAFTAELARRVGGFLGEIALASPRWVHPLGLSHAARYTDQRLALVGDAAHGIHPIAGQGLNMGIRDVAALAEVVVDARRLGRDIGDPDILADYERWRRFDNMLLAVVTDNLLRLFSNDIAPVRAARDLGLGIVNAIPAARKFSMRHAMGVVGDLPRLVRGEAL
ncbi:MAG: UbiH/UbiF/VisC/COQ6 family ubiquinone biosynthesis hydroxylase [Rhodospirillaceae bacterium]|jgi:2-octaprenyl-6-methoxyphenol hydroxylase|nr:UbiH/UbiF/VisC/COQ6 family ubiquinone biosynthesis hydroxylase [Rhodospirillaceae bacterium]MBT5945438.1 UbiH/UbiF/VisC/COQ6 family ubiquinone biosynthesis hydroxylase [Rhodospirillaceae bacterium]MBT6405259.1 UbiH/UbiF/VisC/COQ6 family ubiquinone biosynthesis hydroxylase [Rhodospirillaceae bacterium]MBT6535094.1 UbiH/UbiF/VisC/COQ6 family ubiquinone biosynthesis hydroxylase [Rhodospirillaceae bacterium]MBT7362973.1 UbiH/UbiF/VisC/COQ6 family ubiquinone biosynthesis hydroxylase [Rhodospirill